LEEEVRRVLEALSRAEEELKEAVERRPDFDKVWATLSMVLDKVRGCREILEGLVEEEVGNPEPRSELEVLQAWGVRERQRIRRALREGCLVELVEEVRELRKVLEKLVEEFRRLRTDRLPFT